MKRFGFFLFASLVVLLSFPLELEGKDASGYARRKTVGYDNDITKVVNYSSAEIIIRDGKPSAEIWLYDDKDTFVDFEVNKREIIIRDNDRSKNNSQSETVVIQLENPESIVNHGAGVITCSDLDAVSLSVRNSGAGVVALSDIDCTKLDLNLSGPGMISLSSADTTTLSILNGGPGMISVDNVDTAKTEINVPGPGMVTLGNIDSTTIKVLLSGAGMAVVSGVCSTLTVLNSGSGMVDVQGLDYTIYKGSLKDEGFVLLRN
ncbi:MAG: hypothetical protein HDS24_02240 [Bacteroides sp.]|nr:hypothetical protein [Bacteroides sp.]